MLEEWSLGHLPNCASKRVYSSQVIGSKVCASVVLAFELMGNGQMVEDNEEANIHSEC